MNLAAAGAFLAYAQSARGAWPLPSERKLLTHINTWAAILDNDADQLAKVAQWSDSRRRYRIDSLGERIAVTWSHYLFGEEARFIPADAADEANLAAIVETNELPSELERAATICVGEGEVWARWYVDALAGPTPLLDWLSRRDVLPMWHGSRLAAAGVITELPAPGRSKSVYRHFEIHTPGVVVNALFIGSEENLGQQNALTAHAATASLPIAWEHGLPGLLVGRIPNKIRRDRRVGVSDFASCLDELLDLNEASIIGSSNMRLSARRRAVISASMVGGTNRNDLELTPEESPYGSRPPAPRFDPSEEVFVEDPLDKELGRESSSPLRIIEYSFDAAPLITYKRYLVETALSRVGLVAQYVGVSTDTNDGYAISGTALRLRFIPTDKTGRGKARYWNVGIPRILATGQALDALPNAQGGLGRQWTNASDRPVMERRPGLPEDEIEEAQKHSTLVNAGLESIETAVKRLNPDWGQDEVDEEVGRIREDQAARAPSMTFGA